MLNSSYPSLFKSSVETVASLLISGAAALGIQFPSGEIVSPKLVEVLGIGVLLVILLNQIFTFLAKWKEKNGAGVTLTTKEVVQAINNIEENSSRQLTELSSKVEETTRAIREVHLDLKAVMMKQNESLRMIDDLHKKRS